MSYQDLPVSMHPRYSEFLSFMTKCPYRKTPETMQTAFWAWLNVVEQAEFLICQTEATEDVGAV